MDTCTPVLALLALLAAPHAWAQAQTRIDPGAAQAPIRIDPGAAEAPSRIDPGAAEAPSRIDNVWDGRHHEPDPSRVRARERADGLTSPGADQRDTRSTEDLARTLLNEEAHDRRTDPAFRPAR